MCIERAGMKRRIQLTKFLVSITYIHLCLSAPSVFASFAASDLTIGGYSQTSAAHLSGYQYDYTYTAVITNTGPTIAAVSATLTSSDANIQIIDGTVTFGNIPANSFKVSEDTFTIRQDERYQLDSSMLKWNISFFPDSSRSAMSLAPSMESALTSLNGFQDSIVFSGLTEPTV